MKFLHILGHRLWLAAIGAAFVFELTADDGVVAVSVASMRAEPAHSSELETQALMGMQVALGQQSGDWLRAVTPDGYEAWIHRTAVICLDSLAFERWNRLPKLMVRSLDRRYVVADTLCQQTEPVIDVVNGVVVAGVKSTGKFTEVELPDGRRGFIESDVVDQFDGNPVGNIDVERLLTVARSMMGSPYLWGGTSTLGVDCSGLVRVAFWDQGVMLPRNASQQALTGMAVDCNAESLQPGDLVFFAADSAGTRITHVGIYEGEGKLIHSSGTVHRSDLFTDTLESLPQRMRLARRIVSGSKGTTMEAAADSKFKATSMIAPAAMIGIGAWGVAGGWLQHLDNEVHQKIGVSSMHRIDDVLQFVPDLFMVLPDSWLPGARYNWKERALLTVTGELITEAIVQPVKRLVKFTRPDGSDSHSFPSGHTARAFAGAELLRITYGSWIGLAGYGVATAVGVMRVCSGRHWLTDVIGGAGVGILSAQLARLLLPLERRWFGLNTEKIMALGLSYDPIIRAPLLACHISL